MSRSFAADERVLDAVAQTNALSDESKSSNVWPTHWRKLVRAAHCVAWLGADFAAVCKLAVRLFGSEKQSKRRLTRTACRCNRFN